MTLALKLNQHYTSYHNNYVLFRYGYSVPLKKFHNPNPEPKKEFIIEEPSMTSGTVCYRKYDQNHRVVGVNDKFEPLRTCPHHEPNYLEVTKDMFWEDRRSG